jgi:hypothetical protein
MASHYTQPAARSPKEEPFEDASQRMCLQYVSVVGGSEQKPRDAPTLKRWRDSRRGPSFLKIGGRYYYTIAALREFYQRNVRVGYLKPAGAQSVFANQYVHYLRHLSFASLPRILD